MLVRPYQCNFKSRQARHKFCSVFRFTKYTVRRHFNDMFTWAFFPFLGTPLGSRMIGLHSSSAGSTVNDEPSSQQDQQSMQVVGQTVLDGVNGRVDSSCGDQLLPLFTPKILCYKIFDLHWLFASSTQRHSRFSVPSRMLLYHVDYLWTRDSKGIAANINFFVKETSGKILELLFTILLTISFYDGIRNRGMILGLLRHSIWNMLIMLRENPL